MTANRTYRWRGVVALTLLAGAVGVFAARPALLLVAVVGVAYAAYPHLGDAPDATYAVERSVSTTRPAPGERVTVEVTVRNESGSFHPDVRFVDGVPPMLAVVEGSPRHATALRAGEAASFSYAVRAAAGTHRFEPTTVIARDASGANETEATATAEATLTVPSGKPDAPLRALAAAPTGRLATDTGGDGVEFHRVREYRPGDSLARVDWRRYARSRTLATVEYRAEQSPPVVLCVDVRPRAYRSRAPDEPHAVARSVAAADGLVGAFAASGSAVGAAALGPEPAWVAPDRGDGHVRRLRRALATEGAFSAYPPADDRADVAAALRRLRRDLGSNAHVVLLTPATDRGAVDVAHALRADGHAVTVISPDVTGAGELGGRLARYRRRAALRELRGAGVRVVDWDADESVERALAAASERWSR